MPSSNPRQAGRHATMADVAAHIGVSRQLVGLAFRGEAGVSEETAARIFAAAKEIGYRPNLAAQALRREGSKYIGVVFNTGHSVNEDLLPAIYSAAEELGFKVMLSAVSPNRTDEQAVEEVLGHRCDGLILVASGLALGKLKELAKSLPVISIGRRVTGVNCGIVASEGEVGVSLLVDHLINLGHKSITYIDASDMFDHEFRRQGYENAMIKSKLKTSILEMPGDYLELCGSQAAEKILGSKNLPTAIACANDQVAFGLVYSLQKAGVKVPRDISVVGYDDSFNRLPFLDFTTVHQDATELANAAIADLSARIKGEKSKSETYLTSAKIVVRSSTAKPRAKI